MEMHICKQMKMSLFKIKTENRKAIQVLSGDGFQWKRAGYKESR
jgi:hypothetical protein